MYSHVLGCQLLILKTIASLSLITPGASKGTITAVPPIHYQV